MGPIAALFEANDVKWSRVSRLGALTVSPFGILTLLALRIEIALAAAEVFRRAVEQR